MKDMDRTEERLQHLNSILRAIRNINQLIITEKDKKKLIEGICNIFKAERGYYCAWMVLIDENGKPIEIAESGIGKDFKALVKGINEGRLTPCWEESIASSGIIQKKNPTKECRACPIGDSLNNKYKDRAAMAIQLVHDQKAYGMLSVSVPSKYIDGEEDMELFLEAAGDISFALHVLEKEEDLEQSYNFLKERIKELDCLYRITTLSIKPGIMLDDLLAEIVNMVPPSWQYPDITCCRIILNDNNHESDNCIITKWMQSADIIVDNKKIGVVEVYYTEKKPDIHEGPFLKEKRYLLNGISELIAGFIMRKKSENKLVESEYKYRSLYLSMNEGVCLHEIIYDKRKKPVDYMILDVNNSYERILGLKSKQVIGKMASDIYGTGEAPYIDIYEKVARTGKPKYFEAYFEPMNKHFEISVFSYGKNKFATVFLDITKRKKAEKSLIESEKRYKSIVDHTNDSLFITDFKGKILDINRNTLKLLGYRRREEFLKMDIADFHTGRSSSLIRERMDKVIKKGSAVFDTEFINRNGTIIDVNVSVKLISKAGSGIVQAFVRDTTKRKQAEALLAAEKERTQNYLNIAGVILVVLDGSGKVKMINKKGCEILEYEEDEIIGKNWFNNFLPKRLRAEVKAVAKQIDSGESEPVEYYENPILAKSGKEKMIVWHNTIIRDSNGKNIGILSSGEDITIRKLDGKKLEDSYKKLKNTLDSSINTLASIVELRDPYTSGHQKKVSTIAFAISKEMGLSIDSVEAVKTAALIHDIGKISIPASILSKPGKISTIELEMIKEHPKIGYDLIKGIEFPYAIAEIVLQHHERLDGSGYPDGLKDDRISIEAKILAVADVIEAMSSHRPYRSALGIKAALKEIKANSGKFYDTEVVNACIRLINKKKFKFD